MMISSSVFDNNNNIHHDHQKPIIMKKNKKAQLQRYRQYFKIIRRVSIIGILLFFTIRQFLMAAYLKTNINIGIGIDIDIGIDIIDIDIDDRPLYSNKYPAESKSKSKSYTSIGFMKNRDNHIHNHIYNEKNETMTTTTTKIIKGEEGQQQQQQQQENNNNLHVVVSHCNTPIDWIWKDYLKINNNSNQNQNQSNQNSIIIIKSITIISKCGVPIPPEDMPPSNYNNEALVQIISLPNVGRCDHSYAYWITMVLGNEDKSIMKDNDYQLLYSSNSNSNDNSNSNSNDNSNHHEDCSSNSNNSNKKSSNPFQSISTSINPEDYIIFLKDNDNSYRINIEDNILLQDMFNEMTIPTTTTTTTANTNTTTNNNNGHGRHRRRGSMACSSAVNEKYSKYYNSWTNWAHRSVMWTFEMKNYKQKYNSTNTNNYNNNTSSDNDNKKNSNDNTRDNNDIDSNNTNSNSDTKNVAFRSNYRPMGEWIRYLSTYYNNSNQQVISDNYADMYHNNIDEKHGYYYNYSRGLHLPAKNDTEWTKYHQNYNKLDIVPICFGGKFMTRWGQLSSNDAPIRNWSVITKVLSRGDNIEEGHYMERWWADILSWSSYSSSSYSSSSSSSSSSSYSLSEEQREHNTMMMKTQNNNVRTTTNTNANGSSGDHRRPSGEDLTQNEQKQLLKLKLKHITIHNHNYFPYAGVIILNSEKVKEQVLLLEDENEGSKSMPINWMDAVLVQKMKKIQQQEEIIQKQEEINFAAKENEKKIQKQNETKSNWKTIRQAVVSIRTEEINRAMKEHERQILKQKETNSNWKTIRQAVVSARTVQSLSSTSN